MIVIGSGAAGLSFVLQMPASARIAVIAKGPLHEGATYYAQGGISAVLDACDSVDSHVNDTLDAGAGLCHREVVEHVVAHSRDRVQWLIEQGVIFTHELSADGSQTLHLTREGGHSHRRVVHAADATGRAVEIALEGGLQGCPNVTVYEHCVAVDLVTGRKLGLTDERCHGVYVYSKHTHQVVTLAAPFIVLATGGAGKVYLYTSNPDVATGDGIAMAWRAGCEIANMEFMQFHPTCLFHPKAKSYLITEAIRGEGGRLLLPDGTRFMPAFDNRG